MGCGDVGRRIAKVLLGQGGLASQITATVNSDASVGRCSEIGVKAIKLNLDQPQGDLSFCSGSDVYYTIAPQKYGVRDDRTRALLAAFTADDVLPNRVVVISTTGVYGDCDGAWVDESTPTQPQTERGKRRLDSEQQWLRWGKQVNVSVVILRVPGIYAFSRLPRERLAKRTPVVRAHECGFTNRIHADDLAQVCVIALARGQAGEVYNVTDGTPGKISEYLQEAAQVLGLQPLPEITMAAAQQQLSQGMLSYLSESRKISNRKMLRELEVTLMYPDFRHGIRN